MEADQAISLLTWADVSKIVIGFMASAILIWLGALLKDYFRKRTLKRSVWNVLKNQTSLDAWMSSLDGMCDAADEGNAYAISFDISIPLSDLISELASIDPLKSDIYYELLGAEQVVRQGLNKLNALQMELVKSRTDGSDWKKSNISLRKMIRGQCSALRSDVISMYEAQLDLMKYIQISRDDSVSPIDTLQKSLNKQSKADG